MKLFQLMVEHTPDEDNIDWTKIEPSVNFLKSPKGTCSWPLPLWAFSGLELGQGQCWCLPVVPLPLLGLAVVVAWAPGSVSHANEQSELLEFASSHTWRWGNGR